MADKGFNIDDLLKEKGVGLNIAPFLQSQAQFSAQDVHETKTIAKLRIHVEELNNFIFFIQKYLCQALVLSISCTL